MDIERNRVMGKCLRRFRKEAGLTQKALAERMNKNQSFISKVENAERELSFVEVIFYAEALEAGYDVVVHEIHRSLDKAGLSVQKAEVVAADAVTEQPASAPEA